MYALTLYAHYATADPMLLPAALLGATLCKVEMDNATSRYYLTHDSFDLDALATRLRSGRSGNIAKRDEPRGN